MIIEVPSQLQVGPARRHTHSSFFFSFPKSKLLRLSLTLLLSQRYNNYWESLLFYVIPFLLANLLCKIAYDPGEREERETWNLKLTFHSKLVLQISSLALNSPRRINTNTGPPPNPLLSWLQESSLCRSVCKKGNLFFKSPQCYVLLWALGII